MKVEKIIPISLNKKSALSYATTIASEEIGEDIKNAKFLGGGSFGMAVAITFQDNKKIVVKFLRANDMLKQEVMSLNELNKYSTIKLPKVLFTREKDNNIPVDCYGMESIDGRNAFWAFDFLFASKKKRLAFAEDITTALHNIHKHTNDKFGELDNPIYDDWNDLYKPFAKDVLDSAIELNKNGKLDSKIVNALQNAWDKYDVIFSEKVQEACLIHGDLNIANIMIKNYEVSGIIDPLNTMFADKEYDLFQFDNLTGKWFKLKETYIKKYGASKFINQKLAFYGLYNEVYCYIKSGVLVKSIMNPLVKNMNKVIKEL